MFKDERTQVEINADLDETLIHATLNQKHLVPAFLDALTNTAEYAQLIVNNHPSTKSLDEDDPWWESEDCSYFMEELFELMDSFAPDGYHFGCTEGDGSDFGYWKLPEQD